MLQFLKQQENITLRIKIKKSNIKEDNRICEIVTHLTTDKIHDQKIYIENSVFIYDTIYSEYLRDMNEILYPRIQSNSNTHPDYILSHGTKVYTLDLSNMDIDLHRLYEIMSCTKITLVDKFIGIYDDETDWTLSLQDFIKFIKHIEKKFDSKMYCKYLRWWDDCYKKDLNECPALRKD